MPVTVAPHPSMQKSGRGSNSRDDRPRKTNGRLIKAKQINVRWDLVKKNTHVVTDVEGVELVGSSSIFVKGIGRVTVLNSDGRVVLDCFVYYPSTVQVKFASWISGVFPDDTLPENGARPVADVLKELQQIFDIAGTVVGHALKNETQYLRGLSWDKWSLRDTQKFSEYAQYASNEYNPEPKLKVLAGALLGRVIQAGHHSSVEDSRATNDLCLLNKAAIDAEQSKTTAQARFRWMPSYKPATDPTGSCMPGWADAVSMPIQDIVVSESTAAASVVECDESFAIQSDWTRSSSGAHSRSSSTQTTTASSMTSATASSLIDVRSTKVANAYSKLVAIGQGKAVAVPHIVEITEKYAGGRVFDKLTSSYY